MFITTAEKESIRQTLHELKTRIKDLEIEVVRLKNKSTKTHNQIVRTKEAPWGLKKDGNPRKRPGRPLPAMEVGS